jgi:hypothetical protein
MGAVLGAPVAVTAAGAEETSAAAVERGVAPACPAGDSAATADAATADAATADAATTAATIREQFRASFAAGAVTPPAADLTAVICETS